MSRLQDLSAEPRDRVGKGAARAARRDGKVPAVIYGGKEDPLSIVIDHPQLVKALRTGRFMSTLFNVDVAGKKTRVIPKDVQFHPMTELPVHVDFLRLGKGAKVTVPVAVHFLNEEASPGLKRGGVLNIVRSDVELLAPADAIPEALEVDLTGLDIGDSVHISDVTLPEGVTPTITDRDFTVATVAAPSGMAVDEEGDGEEGEAEGEESKD